jgi:hypothetical protein
MWHPRFNHVFAYTVTEVMPEHSVQREIRMINPYYENNPFAGDPRPEHDRVWSEILESR